MGVSEVNYIFYFPFKVVGGVSILFMRVATHMHKLGYNVTLVDYEDGYMTLNASDEINKIHYCKNIDIELPENSILIMQADLPWGVPKNFKVENMNVFFWVCYPFNFIPVLPSVGREWMSKSFRISICMLRTVLRSSASKCRQFHNLLDETRAVSYMDLPCLDATEKYLNYKVKNLKYLPIIVGNVGQKPLSSVLNRELREIHLAWIGRIADFKISILNKVLGDLKEYSVNSQYKIIFHVIGSGDKMNLLEVGSQEEKFEIITHGTVSIDEMNSLLKDRIDILFAMGTSALEGAKLAIPTLLLDFSYDKITNYKYKFLYEKEGFSLADNLAVTPNQTGRDMKEVIDSVFSIDHGKKCYDYFQNYHCLENNFDKIQSHFDGSTLSYNQLISKRFLTKPRFYLVWKFIKGVFS